LNHNITLTWWEQQKKLLTGSLGDENARLRIWDALPGKPPNSDDPPLHVFSSAKGGRELLRPRALALLSSNDKGQPDFAAVVLRTARANSAEISSLRLTALRGGAEAKNISLWEGGASLPSVAPVPNGRFLAVAGNREHEIRVYPIPNLFKDKPPKFQP